MNVPSLRFPGFVGEWDSQRISDIGEVVTGNTPETSKQHYYGGKKLFVSPADIAEDGNKVSNTIKKLTDAGFEQTRKIRAGASLFVCIGSTIGKVALASEECATNQQINAVVSTAKYSDEFVFYTLCRKANKIRELTAVQAVPIINKTTFSRVSLFAPTLPEQQKIAAFLGVVDAKIAALRARVLGLQTYKRGLMQALFTQTLRFTQPDGTAFPDWQERRLGDVLHEHRLKSTGNEQVYSVSVHKGLVNQIEHLGRSFSASSTENYNRVLPNDIVYTKSPTGDFPLGIIKQSQQERDVIVSPLYGVFTPETPALGYMLHAYFESSINVSNYLSPIVQKGAKNTINVTNQGFLSNSLMLPVSAVEQAKIAAALSALDAKIAAVQGQVDRMHAFKKGLLQQMFV